MVGKRQAARRTTRRASSPALRALGDAIGVGDADWKEFRSHLLAGLGEYRMSGFYDSIAPLEFRDVNEDWYDDPHALGFVAIRVIKDGTPGLATGMARYFLSICDPGPGEPYGPPGVGLAWLFLARNGVAPPIEPARLSELAFFMPQDFFHEVGLEDLLPLSRLVLENRHPLEAWDLHALIAGVAQARLNARAPFVLFDDLMGADWIPADVRRELCRGILWCADEAERIRRRGEVIRAAGRALDEPPNVPRVYWDLSRGGVGALNPGLQRHAVRALVESIGEPIEEVISRFFLKDYGDSQNSTAVSEGVIDLLSAHSERLDEDKVKRWLRKATRSRLASVRRAGYRAGAEIFGRPFCRAALNDPAGSVRDWARDYLSDRRPGRGGRSQAEPKSTEE